ncbi:glycoside hydrolase family protein, partial [Salmonella enterica]|nr:glycoside hydrolase family protein [Salmonella enterica]
MRSILDPVSLILRSEIDCVSVRNCSPRYILHEEEGDRTHAYRDAGGVWTICKGLTHVDGKTVRKGMVLTPVQCDRLDREQEQKALALIDRIVKVSLTPPQKAGIASFCAWNIG